MRFILTLVALVMLSGCLEDQSDGQTIAKINDNYLTEHQFEALLANVTRGQQTPVTPQEVAAKLIDQELAIQSTLRLQLDRRPDVLQQLELAKREVLAGAYAEYIAQWINEPTLPEIERYYEENPFLFEERKVFQLNVMRLPLRLREDAEFVGFLKETSTIKDLKSWILNRNISFISRREIRTAEQLPIAALANLNANLNSGLSVFETDTDIVIYEVEAAVSAPLSITEASSSINAYMVNQRTKSELASALSSLKDESSIELYGKFSQLLGNANAQ